MYFKNVNESARYRVCFVIITVQPNIHNKVPSFSVVTNTGTDHICSVFVVLSYWVILRK